MAKKFLVRAVSAAVDGRLLNPFYRKEQLKRIHDALSDNASGIQQAMAQDGSSLSSSLRPVEVRAEFALALECLADASAAIDPERALRREYAVARGDDDLAVDGAEPVGVVVIEPSCSNSGGGGGHAFLYGLVAAVAPAIATGNVVIVQMPDDSSLLAPPKTPSLVLSLLSGALDHDIFQVTTSELQSHDIGHRHVRVVQHQHQHQHQHQNRQAQDKQQQQKSKEEGTTTTTTTTTLEVRRLAAPEQNVVPRVLAIVDRDLPPGSNTGNDDNPPLQRAADALVTARFGLRGRSPYAPDLVLVSEWAKAEFLVAVAGSVAGMLARGGGGGGGGGGDGSDEEEKTSPRRSDGSSGSNSNRGRQLLMRRVADEGRARMVSMNPEALVFDVHDRRSFLMRDKLPEPCLVVCGVTSMDDAIDTANRYGRLAATYTFASPPMAKYLCQFLDSSLSFVNHFPYFLLFSPLAPSNHPSRLSVPGRADSVYPESLFTLPKQQVCRASETDKVLGEALLLSSSSSPSYSSSRLSSKLLTARMPEVRRLMNSRSLGFFEQGIVTGAVFVLSVGAACAGMAGWWAYKGVLLGAHHFWR